MRAIAAPTAAALTAASLDESPHARGAIHPATVPWSAAATACLAAAVPCLGALARRSRFAPSNKMQQGVFFLSSCGPPPEAAALSGGEMRYVAVPAEAYIHPSNCRYLQQEQ